MANELSEAAWTGFLKKQKLELDDGALRKSLARFDKTDEGKPQPRLEALKDLVEQITKQVAAQAKRKKELGDKPFALVKDQLYALLAQAEALQKKTQAAAAEGDDEEPDTPVLLTTKMVPLLRELRKGEVQMHALICTAGKNTAVLVMRRPIAAGRRKLLAEAVDAKGGMKYIAGECMFENKALTFVVQSPAAQLAKRVRQALLDQTQLRFKVKVRGEDGEDSDGEDEDDQAQPGAQPQARSAPPGGPASAEQLAYTQRLRKVRERYEQALREQHPESTKLRAVMGFASEKADGLKDYAAAGKALETLEKLLDAPVPSKSPEATAAEFTARLKVFTQHLAKAQASDPAASKEAKLKASEAGVLARKGEFGPALALLGEAEKLVRDAGAPQEATDKPLSVWIDAKGLVGDQITQLQSKLRDTGHPLFKELADKGLNGITRRLQVGLQASLMDYDRAADPQAKEQAKSAVLSQVAAFRGFVQGSAAVGLIDRNPFGVKVSVRSTLTGAFDAIERALAS